MLQSISLDQTSCFGHDEGLRELDKINFVFGPNGSGKTTISERLKNASSDEAIAQFLQWKNDSPLTIKVFNSKYVTNTFSGSDEVPGVFLLGEDNARLSEQIKEASREAERNRSRYEDLKSTLKEKNTRKNEIEERAAEEVWRKHSRVPEILKKR